MRFVVLELLISIVLIKSCNGINEHKVVHSVQTTNSVSDTQVLVPQAVQQQAPYYYEQPYQYYYSQPTYYYNNNPSIIPNNGLGVGAFYLTPNGLGNVYVCFVWANCRTTGHSSIN
ncbi:hypothetical protein M3Y98_00116000 [Aphelenchoides besseyi]|nr:hypothetical protein M3Y98_00116000 [Aphelenchoides besseyi]